MNMAACNRIRRGGGRRRGRWGRKDVQYASLRTYFGRTPRGRAGHVPPWATIFITNRSPARGWQSNTSCVSMFLAQRDRARAGARARAGSCPDPSLGFRSALHGAEHSGKSATDHHKQADGPLSNLLHSLSEFTLLAESICPDSLLGFSRSREIFS